MLIASPCLNLWVYTAYRKDSVIKVKAHHFKPSYHFYKDREAKPLFINMQDNSQYVQLEDSLKGLWMQWGKHIRSHSLILFCLWPNTLCSFSFELNLMEKGGNPYDYLKTVYAWLREEVDATFPSGKEPFDQRRLAEIPFYMLACRPTQNLLLGRSVSD